MARNRRGWAPPEIKGTLGTLLRSTLQQASVVRDAIGRGVDDLRHSRKRQDLLAELGSVVLDLVHRGEIDLEELPEARPLIEQLLGDEDAGPDVAVPPSRSRFDSRGAEDDGTVSSSSAAARWKLPKQGQPAAARVWRPENPAVAPSPAAPATNKGGISFGDDDEDLAEYMHPDDVPPKDG